MRQPIRAFTFATLLAIGTAIVSPFVAAQVPQQLQPPANEQLLLQVHAKGDQVYTCKADAAQFTWTLKAPDAQLFDETGKPFGKHFAGPSWEASDGSRVTGKAVANVPSPDANSAILRRLPLLRPQVTRLFLKATSLPLTDLCPTVA